MTEDDNTAQLYLILRKGWFEAGMLYLPRWASAYPEIACVRAIGPFEDEDHGRLKELANLCHSNDLPLVITDEFERAIATARTVDADGVHLKYERGCVPRARDELGAEAIIGVGFRDARHEALIAAEDGADYVAFAPDWKKAAETPEILAWWAAMIETPMIVENANTPERLNLACAAAEFIAIHPQSVDEIDAALESAAAAIRAAA